MAHTTTDDIKSLILCSRVVGCWFLAIALLPPGGLLWQLGIIDTFGDWLIHGVLAFVDLSGLIR